MSFFLGALVEIPCWSTPFLINKVSIAFQTMPPLTISPMQGFLSCVLQLGRRWPLLLLFFTSGCSSFLYGLVPPHWGPCALILALLGERSFKWVEQSAVPDQATLPPPVFSVMRVKSAWPGGSRKQPFSAAMARNNSPLSIPRFIHQLEYSRLEYKSSQRRGPSR